MAYLMEVPDSVMGLERVKEESDEITRIQKHSFVLIINVYEYQRRDAEKELKWFRKQVIKNHQHDAPHCEVYIQLLKFLDFDGNTVIAHYPIQESVGGNPQQPPTDTDPATHNLEDTSVLPDFSTKRKVYSSITSGDSGLPTDVKTRVHEDQNSMEENNPPDRNSENGKASGNFKDGIQSNDTTLINETDGSEEAHNNKELWLIYDEPPKHVAEADSDDSVKVISYCCSESFCLESICKSKGGEVKTYGNEDKNPMPPAINIQMGKDLIQRNFTILICDIDGTELAQWLFQRGVLNKQELVSSDKASRSILVKLFRRKDYKWVPMFMTFLKTKYSHLYRLVLGTDEKLCKPQRHVLMAKLYQSGVSEDYTAQILRENIRRNIARLSRSYVPRDKDQNMKENQSALIDLLGRSSDDWVFPFVNFCRKNLQKKAFEEMFGIISQEEINLKGNQ